MLSKRAAWPVSIIVLVLLFYNHREKAQTWDLEWHVHTALGAPDGVQKLMYQINGQSPGPEIHAVVGDVLRVKVHNDLDSEFVSMHWHGLKQRGSNHMDGVEGVTECGIPPNSSFTYVLNLDEPGTFWYHSHHHFQRIDGLVGALIVYPTVQAHDTVVIMQDWYHDKMHDVWKGYMSRESGGFEPVPDNGLINGLNRFQEHGSHGHVPVNFSEKCQMRLINAAAFATFNFSIDEHQLLVVQADATDIEPLETHSLDIAPGQRYLVEVDPVKPAYIRAEMSMADFQYIPTWLNQTVLSVMSNSPDAVPKTRPWTGDVHVKWNELVPVGQRVPPEPTIRLTVSIQTMKLEKVDLAPFAFFNRTSFVPAVGAPNLHVALGIIQSTVEVPSVSAETPHYGGSQLVVDIPHNAVVELIVNNPDDSDHPLHLHGHDFWVMHTHESTRGLGKWSLKSVPKYAKFPMIRDTHVVPKLGHTVLRWVADHPGIWAFHCHVLWHHAAGLSMQFAHGMDHFCERIPPQQLDNCAFQKSLGTSQAQPLPKPADRFSHF